MTDRSEGPLCDPEGQRCPGCGSTHPNRHALGCTAVARAEAEPYYEAEIRRTILGYYALVFVVEGGDRTEAGDTRNRLGGFDPSREAAVARAREIAHKHRDGPDIVRLDLDNKPEGGTPNA